MNTTKLTGILLFAAFASLSIHGQTVTNIDIRATVTVLTNGVQQSSANTTMNLLASGAKDKTRIDGLAWAYAAARAGGFTNTFDNWIAKTWSKDNADVTAAAKLNSDNDLALRQLADLLKVNFDLLSAGDVTSLNSIRAKSPITQ